MSIFTFIDSTSTSTETNDELPMLKEYDCFLLGTL